MKLAELKGEKAIEVIADLIDPVTKIASDPKFAGLFKARRIEGESDRQMTIRNLTEKLPDLIRSHKRDVLSIICAVNGKNPDELSMSEIIGGAIQLGHDEDFLSLFLSAVNTEDEISPTASSADADLSKPE